MTDYNDGKWHGWNGEMEHPPIDPKSVVEIRYSDPLYDGIISAEAGGFLWGTLPGASIIAFRVTKPAPPKPREWFVSGGNCIWDTYAEAYNACDRGEKPIRVREVLPD